MIGWLSRSIPRRVACEVGVAAAAAGLASFAWPWLAAPGAVAVGCVAWEAARRHAAAPLSRLRARLAVAEREGHVGRAAVERADEIGAVAEAANRLLARITGMEASLIDAHREIETQRDVEARLRDALAFHAARVAPQAPQQQQAAAAGPSSRGQLR